MDKSILSKLWHGSNKNLEVVLIWKQNSNSLSKKTIHYQNF